MPLRIHDTRTRKKAPFEPIVPGKVSLYACGTTVYDLCHIGHARKEIAWDVITRHLRASGFELRFVRNITDVDDKIINKANEEKRSAEEVARHYTEEMNVDMIAITSINAADPSVSEEVSTTIRSASRSRSAPSAPRVGPSISPDGRWIVSGGADKVVRIWDAVSGKVVKELKGHRSPVTAALFSPDGKQVLSCSGDKTLKLYEGHYHDLLLDYGRETVMADITGWIAARLPKA